MLKWLFREMTNNNKIIIKYLVRVTPYSYIVEICILISPLYTTILQR